MRLTILAVVLCATQICVVTGAGVGGNPFAPGSKADAVALAKRYSAMTEGDTKALWGQYKSAFAKTYTVSTEEATRLGNFKANIADIIRTNANPALTHWAGLNQFADMSWDEFKSTVLMPDRGLQAASDSGSAAVSTGRKLLKTKSNTRKLLQTLPKTVDWRAAGKVFPIQDQGRCGSCWSFASTSVMESFALIKGNLTLDMKMSEQQILDCTYNRDGCNGGYGREAFGYMYNKNLTTAAAYPGGYVSGQYGVSFACKTTQLSATAPAPIVKPVKNPGYTKVQQFSATSFLSTIANQGPIDMAFFVKTGFQNYAGGIYADACKMSTSTAKSNHEMAAVGFDITAGLGSANSFIIIKNSWGVNWGEKGFARVQAMKDGAGVCGTYFDNYIPN